jgi:sialate O-acetylesterase
MVRKCSLGWVVVLFAQVADAELVLAPLFRDGAVLQREKPVPVWGRAEPGAAVAITFGAQIKTTTADGTGRWMVELDPLAASSEPSALRATENGGEAVTVKGLLVGEVWLASGQSNMQWSIAQSRQEDQAIAAGGPVPLLRMFQVPRVVSHNRMETVDGSWQEATPEASREFSAVGYFFGRKLVEELGIPVGIIHSSWGGSRIEPWWAEEGFDGVPELAETKAERLLKSPGFPGYDEPFRAFVHATRTWSDQAAAALEAGTAVPEMPKAPERLGIGPSGPAGTYQAMIHPLVPYALRGFIWYQGESNNGEGLLYTAKKQVLIQGWRKQFRAPEGPFLFVQLAPYNYGAERDHDLPGIWKAQQETLRIPHTGMAVINDIGNVRDIHPGNKSEVGRRLALWALADTYGHAELVKSGPLFTGFEVNHGALIVNFAHTGSGLTTRDGKEPSHFEIAASDGVYHPATAKISDDGATIQLSSPAVPRPDRARFAWSQLAEPNLMNREGLPAGAFNSHWPNDPTLGKNVSAGKPHQSSHPNPFNWNSGLTDGVWGGSAGSCFATDNSANFPKSVTIDLGAAQPVHAVIYGVPSIGSTRTVAVSVSADGTSFEEVGRTAFAPKKAARAEARFEARPTRFVRASFLDAHPQQDQFDANFAFLSELEAYVP